MADNTTHCFCGGKTFHVEQEVGGKGRVRFFCTLCRCRRTITTPEVAVKTYEVFPPLTVPKTEAPSG